jgi:hypothetical protein
MLRYRVQCSIIEASLGRYATHQYITLCNFGFVLTVCAGQSRNKL